MYRCRRSKIGIGASKKPQYKIMNMHAFDVIRRGSQLRVGHLFVWNGRQRSLNIIYENDGISMIQSELNTVMLYVFSFFILFLLAFNLQNSGNIYRMSKTPQYQRN